MLPDVSNNNKEATTESFEKIISRISNPGLALCAGSRDHEINYISPLETVAGE